MDQGRNILILSSVPLSLSLSLSLSLQPTAPQQGVVNPPTLPGADNLDLPPVPRSSFPPPASGPPPNDTGDMDFDDLTRRFEELKRRK